LFHTTNNNNKIWIRGHSPGEFMHDLYVVWIYRSYRFAADSISLSGHFYTSSTKKLYTI